MTARRRKLTDCEKDVIIARQGGVCPGLPGFGIKCGKPVTRDTAEFDHIDQRHFTASDALDQFQALCRGDRTSCAAVKTNGKPGAGSAGSDVNKRVKARDAKDRRLIREARQLEKTGRHQAARAKLEQLSTRKFRDRERARRLRREQRDRMKLKAKRKLARARAAERGR
ncbi:MAG: HNH endonuclease signature motif containing protein [Hyphomicrobium sp.]